MKSASLLLFSLVLAFTNCSKKSTGNNDIELPVITITSPSNNQTFTNGQSITISGSVTDNKLIAEIHIHVYNNSTGEEISDNHLNPNNASAAFNQVMVASTGINYKIEIIAIDGAVNEARKSVLVSCN